MDGARALAAADKYQFQWWAVSLVNAVPFGGKKRGADTGIDGHIYFKPDGKTTEKAIVSVKGGEHVSVNMIRDLGHVIDREKAKIGVFITLTPPTRPMEVEAIKAGFYEPPYHGKVPKIQILTIEDLFAGKRPQNSDDRSQYVQESAGGGERQSGRPVLTLKDEVAKCDLVCSNCHRVRSHSRLKAPSRCHTEAPKSRMH